MSAPRVYYNEIDEHAAAWLRNLITAGMIPDGEIDARSIVDVRADDLRGFRQWHFFAGIGVWPYALGRIGWPDDMPIASGSCPCPPFSAAGKKQPCPQCASRTLLPHVGRTGVFVCCACGHEWIADERHLWPEMWRILRDLRPPVFVGEQVASPDGEYWLALVRASLEILGYAVRATDLPAAGVGAPHLRQRLWFVADADDGNAGAEGLQRSGQHRQQPENGRFGELADDNSGGRPQGRQTGASMGHGGAATTNRGVSALPDGSPVGLEHATRDGREQRGSEPGGRGAECGRGAHGVALGDTVGSRLEGQPGHGHNSGQPGWIGEEAAGSIAAPGFVNGFWSDAEWIPCSDGKARPAKPGIFPLVDGASFRLGSGGPFEGKSRIGMLKGAGNAIVAEAAIAFLTAAMEVRP